MGISRTLTEELLTICKVLNDSDFDYCLVGGLAVSMLATPRATEDIDLLVAITEESKEAFAELLSKEYMVIQSSENFEFEHVCLWRIILKRNNCNESPVCILDILFADDELYQKVLSEKGIVEIKGVEIPVINVSNLIAIKERSNRPRDLLDIEDLRMNGRD